MKFAGAVVLYNPDEKDVLDNIKSYIGFLDKLYLVDNSITNNKHKFKNVDSNKIEYIWNEGNLGMATALNVVARKAISDGFMWLLTMDQDSKFKDNSLLYLEKYIKSEFPKNARLAIVSPFHETVLSADNKPDVNTVDKPIIVMTSGNIINLDAYQKIGGFKDWYFIDCVDFDYCLNLIRNKYEIHQVNKSILSHELGDTVKKVLFGKVYFCDNHNYIRRYYIVRNRHYIYDEYKDDFPDYCAAEIRCTRAEVKRIILFEKNKIKKLWYMYKGYKDYKAKLTGRIDNLKKRN
ncbi:glycosyltransferase [Thomasclavelia sp.]